MFAIFFCQRNKISESHIKKDLPYDGCENGRDMTIVSFSTRLNGYNLAGVVYTVPRDGLLDNSKERSKNIQGVSILLKTFS